MRDCVLMRGQSACAANSTFGPTAADPEFSIDDDGPTPLAIGNELVMLDHRYPDGETLPDGTTGSPTYLWTSDDGGRTFTGPGITGNLPVSGNAVVWGGANPQIAWITDTQTGGTFFQSASAGRLHRRPAQPRRFGAGPGHRRAAGRRRHVADRRVPGSEPPHLRPRVLRQRQRRRQRQLVTRGGRRLRLLADRRRPERRLPALPAGLRPGARRAEDRRRPAGRRSGQDPLRPRLRPLQLRDQRGLRRPADRRLHQRRREQQGLGHHLGQRHELVHAPADRQRRDRSLPPLSWAPPATAAASSPSRFPSPAAPRSTQSTSPSSGRCRPPACPVWATSTAAARAAWAATPTRPRPAATSTSATSTRSPRTAAASCATSPTRQATRRSPRARSASTACRSSPTPARRS